MNGLVRNMGSNLINQSSVSQTCLVSSACTQSLRNPVENFANNKLTHFFSRRFESSKAQKQSDPLHDFDANHQVCLACVYLPIFHYIDFFWGVRYMCFCVLENLYKFLF